MEVQDVFGWAILVVVGMVLGALVKQRHGPVAIAGLLVVIAIFTLGYSWGVRAGAWQAADIASHAMEACQPHYDVDRHESVTDSAACIRNSITIGTQLRDIKLPQWAELGSILAVVFGLLYLLRSFVQLAVKASPAKVEVPSDDGQK